MSNAQTDHHYSEGKYALHHEEEYVEIFYRRWQVRNPRGDVLIIHGIGEHSGRYDFVAETLNAAGFSVMVPDLRGHGKNQQAKGYIGSMEALMRDIRKAHRQMSDQLHRPFEPDPQPVPLFLYGHSFGGLVALKFAFDNAYLFNGVIITSPALRIAIKTASWKTALGKLVGKFFPKLGFNNGILPEHLSDDPEVIQQVQKDKLMHSKVTPSAFFGMTEQGQWCLDNASQYNDELPTLIMHGDQDQVTDHQASIQFCDKAPDCCQLKIWENGKHELHQMTFRRQVLEHIIRFQNTCIHEENLNTD